MPPPAAAAADASKPPLRFDVGAKVECNVGTFVRGTVIALHYREPDWPPGRYAPYQVQLDDGRLIYAPHDHDKLVRLCRVYPLVNAAFASANGKIDVLAKAIEQAASGEGMTQMDVVDVNEADAAGLTALGIVCARGDVAAAKLLVENGADVLGMDGSGRVPLHHAVEHGDITLVTTLLEAGSPLDVQDYEPEGIRQAMFGQKKGNDTPLHVALKNEHEEIAQLLIKRGAAIDVVDAYGSTPLAIALEEKSYDIAAELLASKCSQTLGEGSLGSLLHGYSGKGNKRVVEMLLKAPRGDAPVNEVEPSSNMTPLHLAARRGAVDVVRMLLAAGADASLQTKSGQTALELAEANGKAEAAAALRAAPCAAGGVSAGGDA